MAKTLNPTWVHEMERKLKDPNYRLNEVISYKPAIQWLVAHCANHNIPVKCIALGAGVTRVVEAEHICPHCKGKGAI